MSSVAEAIKVAAISILVLGVIVTVLSLMIFGFNDIPQQPPARTNVDDIIDEFNYEKYQHEPYRGY